MQGRKFTNQKNPHHPKKCSKDLKHCCMTFINKNRTVKSVLQKSHGQENKFNCITNYGPGGEQPTLSALSLWFRTLIFECAFVFMCERGTWEPRCAKSRKILDLITPKKCVNLLTWLPAREARGCVQDGSTLHTHTHTLTHPSRHE